MRSSSLSQATHLWIALASIALAYLVTALPSTTIPSADFLQTGLRFLYQNDLNWERAENAASRQPGYILLNGPLTQQQADTKCKALSESLARLPASGGVEPGMQSQLSYLLFEKAYQTGQQFWVAGGKTVTLAGTNRAVVTASPPSAATRLPALCTQSAPWNHANATDSSLPWQVITQVDGLEFNGYRDALSFRFLAVPYANPTERFAYSTVLSADQARKACTREGRYKQCPQTAGTDSTWSEQCLVTNIFTPYLPTSSQIAKREQLRPILLWIHGGGYTSGSGLDFTFDGGQMASRSDVVVMTTNYRLGALGHLAYNDEIRGNYGLGDLVTVLRWIQKYGPSFGGDPKRVTIAGQSAGAQHVEHLLASPAAAGLFHRAIVMSGKGADEKFNFATIAEAKQNKTQAVVNKLGCGSANDVLACLRRLNTTAFFSAPYTGTVQDGVYIDGPRLDMRSPSQASGHVNRVPVIWGHMRDEKAALGTVAPLSVTDLKQAMTIASIAPKDQTTVLNNPNAFPVNTYGVQNLTVTVDTELGYSCPIEATAYASAANGVMPRTYAYVYDQRAWQIPNYDPNAVCQSHSSNPEDSYFCHSGDLMSLFASAGSAFSLRFRDDKDLGWITLVLDQFSAFVRTGSPAPSVEYLRARGKEYAHTLDFATQGNQRWTTINADGTYRAMSLGVVQKMTGLSRPLNQCAVLGKPVTYVSQL